MHPASHLRTHHGVVEDLTRTTHITGGGETSATTTHIAMVKVAGKHCEYRSGSPVPISEGEVVRVVGLDERGLFKVYAMKNESTGFVSEQFKIGAVGSGCLIVFMIIWCTVCLGMTIAAASFLLPVAIVPLAMGGFGVWAMSNSIRTNKRNLTLSRQAHMMLMNAGPPSLPRSGPSSLTGSTPPPVPPR